MNISISTLRHENAAAIATARTAFAGLHIDDNNGINSTIHTLRTSGTSSFAIREGLKETGLLNYEDDNDANA